MANTASGSRVRIVYGTETTQGTTFAGTTKVLRTTTRRINVRKNVVQSAEVRSDRNIKDVRHGFVSVDAALGFELSLSSYDDYFEYLMANTWATIATQGAPNLGAATANTFTRATGSWVADGLRAGDMITTTGFSNSANNGTFRVLTVTTTTIVVDSALIVTEAQGAAKTLVVTGKRVEPGTITPHKTATIERQFLDLAKYQVFNGMSVVSMPLSIQPNNAIVKGTWNMIGMSGGTITGTPINANPTLAASNAPFSSFEGRLYEGGAQIAIVTGLELMLENARTLQGVVGAKTSPEVYEGQMKVTGTLTALFQNETILNKFLNETSTSLFCSLNDLNGVDFHNIVLPNVLYTGGDIDPPGDGAVPISLPFQARLDNTTGVVVSWQRSN